MQKYIIFLCIALALSLSSYDIPNFDKYYKPYEFSDMDMFQSSSKWSWHRYKQSEHFFVFWEAAFGNDPNSNSVPSNLRVDIDDLLAKAEQFYQTNIVSTQFCTVGQGRSYLDIYKMEIYLLYQTEWLATGSGYDNVIGALWVNPSTCQPVGSTIGHEIGHSFQYQVYCDQILTMKQENMTSKVDLDMDMMVQKEVMASGNKQLNGNLSKIILMNFSQIGFLNGLTIIIVILSMNI